MTDCNCLPLAPSISLLKITIWAAVDPPGRKPFWFIHRSRSRIELFLSRSNLFQILAATTVKDIPRKLPVSPRSPFFGNGIVPLLTQISALFPFNVLFHTSRSCILSAPISQTSMGILSRPDALLFLKFFMHLFSYSLMKLSVLIGNVRCNTVFFF